LQPQAKGERRSRASHRSLLGDRIAGIIEFCENLWLIVEIKIDVYLTGLQDLQILLNLKKKC
jgi:hypothetical protein